MLLSHRSLKEEKFRDAFELSRQFLFIFSESPKKYGETHETPQISTEMRRRNEKVDVWLQKKYFLIMTQHVRSGDVQVNNF